MLSMLFGMNNSFAQSQNSVKLLAKRDGNNIKLRWAPINENIWLNQRLKGYRVSRLIWDKQNSISAENYEVLEDLIPLDLQNFEQQYNNTNNNYLAVMAETLYGDWETLKEGDVPTDNWVNKVEELRTKYTMAMYAADMDFDAAHAAALGFEDKGLDSNKKYVYKIEALGDSLQIVAIHVVLPQKAEASKVIIDQAIEGEGHVALKWDRPLHQKMFTAYYIERSKDGKNYERINDIPYINPVTDSYPDAKTHITFSEELTNYDPYYYRVIGIDPFGDLSEPSESKRLQGRDLTPPAAPRIDSIISDDQVRYINIAWDNNASSIDWDKTVIQRSIDSDGPFYDIVSLPKLSLYYKDETIQENTRYYYKVCAVDTASNYGCTGVYGATINDRLPPAKPMGINGVIDTNGLVTVNWIANDEQDLKGYYVHFSNGADRVFGNLTPTALTQNIFQDTLDLNTLTETIEYKVIAVDHRQNYSEFSDVLVLKKPDVIPPSPAVFKSYDVSAKGVSLMIANSSSHDLKETILLRREKEKEYVELLRFSDKEINYIDTTIVSNKKYEYTLRAFDDDKNMTLSPENLRIRTKDDKHLHEVTLSITAIEGGVELKWNNVKEDNARVTIYKSSGQRQTTLKTIKLPERSYVHKTDKSYAYQVRIEYSDGTYSAFSNLVRL